MADLRQKQIVDRIFDNLVAGAGNEFNHVAMFYGFALPEEIYTDQVAIEILPGEETNLQGAEEQSATKVSLAFNLGLILHYGGTRSTTTYESDVYSILCEAVKKCYSLIMADYTQGLDFVFNTRYVGADGLEIDGGEFVYGKMMLNFEIFYKHSHTDASQ